MEVASLRLEMDRSNASLQVGLSSKIAIRHPTLSAIPGVLSPIRK